MKMINFIKQLSLFVLLVFLQIWVFNKLYIFGLVVPLIYVYFIIQMPVNLSRNTVLLFSVFMGCCLDVFSDLFGLHLLACVVIGFVRFYLLKIIDPTTALIKNYSPSINFFGRKRFFYYSFLMIFLHHTVLLMAEYFSFADFFSLIFRLLVSVCSTLFFVFVIEFFSYVN